MTGKRQLQMQQSRNRLIEAGRKAFAADGFAAASMDDLTASAGLTRGALYHHFGDKRGLFAAVVDQMDAEMAAEALAIGARESNPWDCMLAEGIAYVEMALRPDVQRIVLLDGPAVLGDPSLWPSQNACLVATERNVRTLIERGDMQDVDALAAARLLTGAALNAALWVAANPSPETALPKAITAFRAMANGLRRVN